MQEALSPESSRPVEAQDLPQKLQEIISGMNEVFEKEMRDGTAERYNPDLLKVSRLETPTESTRIQWDKNLAAIGGPGDEEVYKIRRELGRIPFQTNQKVLTVYIKPGSEPRGVLTLIRGNTNTKGEVQNPEYTHTTITENEIEEFKGVLTQKLNPPPSQ